jgi:hypothetical protein
MDTSAFAFNKAIQANNNPGPIPSDPRLSRFSRDERIKLERNALERRVPVSQILDEMDRQAAIDAARPKYSYINGVLHLNGRRATPEEVEAYNRGNPYNPQNFIPKPLSPEVQAALERSDKEISERNAAERQRQIQQIMQQVTPVPPEYNGLRPQPPMPAPFNPPNGVFQMPVTLGPKPLDSGMLGYPPTTDKTPPTAPVLEQVIQGLMQLASPRPAVSDAKTDQPVLPAVFAGKTTEPVSGVRQQEIHGLRDGASPPDARQQVIHGLMDGASPPSAALSGVSPQPVIRPYPTHPKEVFPIPVNSPPMSLNPAAFGFPQQLKGVPLSNMPIQQPFFGLSTRTGRAM